MIEMYDVLNLYKKYNFSLIPITTKRKSPPCEKDWNNKTHYDKEEWKKWLNKDYNIAVNCGKKSGITVIDLDTKEFPTELKKLLVPTLTQQTKRGYQFFYTYEEDIPTSTNLNNLKIDILNDNKYCLLTPSEADNVPRKIIRELPIANMTNDLRSYIIKLIHNINIITDDNKDSINKYTIDNYNFNSNILHKIPVGYRTSLLIKIGGILRKNLNLKQTEFVLQIFNKYFTNEPLPSKELYNLFKSLEKYLDIDIDIIKDKIYKYLCMMEEATNRDIKEVIGERKAVIDKAIATLLEEELIIKTNNKYKVYKKAKWETNIDDTSKRINFNMPYFNHCAYFCKGDIILIGAKTGHGKSHIALNIIKKLVEQGTTPYYISTESGSRFKYICYILNLKNHDFYWEFESDATKIQLEDNAVTIIDWLNIKDFTETHTIFNHFTKQLHKTNGVLIVFNQLKNDNEWFAKNLIEQFAALSAKYIQDLDNRDIGKFVITKIREPKTKYAYEEILCKFDWDTKILEPIIDFKKVAPEI